MGPVNWLAVLLGAALATALALPWYRLWRRGKAPALPLLGLAMLIPAALIGHNFARVGAGVLAEKPWLYFMMSGGFALTMIGPALAVACQQSGSGWRQWAVDAGYWLMAFLIIGATFWALR